MPQARQSARYAAPKHGQRFHSVDTWVFLKIGESVNGWRKIRRSVFRRRPSGGLLLFNLRKIDRFGWGSVHCLLLPPEFSDGVHRLIQCVLRQLADMGKAIL